MTNEMYELRSEIKKKIKKKLINMLSNVIRNDGKIKKKWEKNIKGKVDICLYLFFLYLF